MHPSPKAETSRPLFPSFGVFIACLSWRLYVRSLDRMARVLGRGFPCSPDSRNPEQRTESYKLSLMLQFRQQDLGLGGQRIRAIHVA